MRLFLSVSDVSDSLLVPDSSVCGSVEDSGSFGSFGSFVASFSLGGVWKFASYIEDKTQIYKNKSLVQGESRTFPFTVMLGFGLIA